MEDPRCSLVVQMPGWTGMANARVTIFGDVYQLPPEMHDAAREVPRPHTNCQLCLPLPPLFLPPASPPRPSLSLPPSLILAYTNENFGLGMSFSQNMMNGI